jgi:hypothetical protein
MSINTVMDEQMDYEWTSGGVREIDQMDYRWTSGGVQEIDHIELIACGGSGEVHKVFAFSNILS